MWGNLMNEWFEAYFLGAISGIVLHFIALAVLQRERIIYRQRLAELRDEILELRIEKAAREPSWRFPSGATVTFGKVADVYESRN